MTSRAALSVISHGASLTNGLTSMNYINFILKTGRLEKKVIGRSWVMNKNWYGSRSMFENQHPFSPLSSLGSPFLLRNTACQLKRRMKCWICLSANEEPHLICSFSMSGGCMGGMSSRAFEGGPISRRDLDHYTIKNTS